MKKTISQVNKQRIDDLVIALNGIENKIPYILKQYSTLKEGSLQKLQKLP